MKDSGEFHTQTNSLTQVVLGNMMQNYCYRIPQNIRGH
jgi:hypothetical protein